MLLLPILLLLFRSMCRSLPFVIAVGAPAGAAADAAVVDLQQRFP